MMFSFRKIAGKTNIPPSPRDKYSFTAKVNAPSLTFSKQKSGSSHVRRAALFLLITK